MTSFETIDSARQAVASVGRLPVLDSHGLPWTLLDVAGELRARPRHLDTATPPDLRAVTTAAALLSDAGPLSVDEEAR